MNPSIHRNSGWQTTARLPKQAFRQIAHPHGRSFLGIPLQTRETWEMYATYYDAMIRAAEAGQTTLPKLHELAGNTPKESWKASVSPHPFEPDWDPFHLSTEGNRCQVPTRFAAGRLAAPERTDHRPKPTGSSRLVLL